MNSQLEKTQMNIHSQTLLHLETLASALRLDAESRTFGLASDATSEETLRRIVGHEGLLAFIREQAVAATMTTTVLERNACARSVLRDARAYEEALYTFVEALETLERAEVAA